MGNRSSSRFTAPRDFFATAPARPTAAPIAGATFPTPRAIAITADGQRVFVTRFISPELEGQIAEFAGSAAALTLTRTVTLSSANTTDGGDRAAGVPNYLAAIAISPDGRRAAVASKQDNVQRGLIFGVGDLTHETTVRSVVSFLDLSTNAEIRDTRRTLITPTAPAHLPTPRSATPFSSRCRGITA
jgi:DNA-binding beta-propeller fold protein YncE